MVNQKTQLVLELEAGMHMLLGAEILARIYPSDIGAQQLARETRLTFDESIKEAKEILDEKDILHLFEKLEALR